jgi:hypothetical protein
MRKEKESAMDTCRRSQSRADEMQNDLERANRHLAENADTIRRLETVRAGIPTLEVRVHDSCLFV